MVGATAGRAPFSRKRVIIRLNERAASLSRFRMIRLFRVFVPVGALTLLVSEILLLTAVFILAAYIVQGVDPTVFLLDDGGLARIFLVVATIVLGLHFHDLYVNIHVRSRVALIQQLCQVVGIAFIAQGFINYLQPDLGLPLDIVVWGLPLAFAAMYLWRMFFSAIALEVVGRSRLLLVGSSPLLAEIGEYLEAHPGGTMAVAGYVDDRYERGTEFPGGVVHGPVASLLEIVQRTQARRIVLGLSEAQSRAAAESLLQLRFAGWAIDEAAAAHEMICRRVSLLGSSQQLIFSRQFEPVPQRLALEGLANFVAAAIAILALSPLMLLTAALVRLTSRGPALRKDRRVGLGGAAFTLMRFRLARHDPERGGRLNTLGAAMRRLRIDALPQLFNVLKGEMSFVGPPPERVEFYETLCRLLPPYRQRHSVRPGMTGWRQINGAALNALKGAEYDLYYVKNASFTLDVLIGVQALKAVVLGLSEPRP
jgi:lipopolysaccharide/colanic/teichoic acid biosynthesis glycosyltransferase